MNTQRTILQVVGSGMLLMGYLACSDDSSTTGPRSGAGGGTTTNPTTTNPTTTMGTGGAGPASTTATTGSGGSPAGTGGTPTTGSAGTTGAGGGTGGAGMGGAGGGTGSCPAPSATSGLISDFATMNVANQLTGGTDTWYSPGTAMVMNGAMHFVVNPNDAGTDYPAVSTLIASKPGMKGCVDLTAKYTSVSFKISSPTNTSLLFEVVSLEAANAQDGSGFRSSFMLNATPATVTLQLSALMPPSFGVGMMQAAMPGFNISKDAAAIVFGVGTAGQKLDITVDDVTFQ
jgi:hypothetical protein